MEGIVPGGGCALLAARELAQIKIEHPEQAHGVNAVFEALAEPIRQMAENAGLSADLTLSRVMEIQKKNSSASVGFNFRTGKLENLQEAGIIDPVKVTISALRNAASVASTLLTTNYAIVEEE
jgi:chaperonin GroEL